MAILPYVAPREPLLSSRQPLLLFGTEILTSDIRQGVFIEQGNPPQNSKSVWCLGDDDVRDVGKESYDHQVEPTLSLGSDPFIFGTGNLAGKNLKWRLGRNTGSRRLHRSKFVPPELGKRMDREKDYVGRFHATKKCASSSLMNFTTAEDDKVQPRRMQ